MAGQSDRSLVSSVKHDDVARLPSNLASMTAGQICDAFLESEDIYVHDGLRVLAEQFEKRLRCHNLVNASILSDAEIDAVFLNIDALYTVNHRLYRDLLSARLASDLPGQVGRILCQMIPYFKLYATYINRQKGALQVMLQLRRRRNRFSEFVKIGERCAGDRPLAKLMEGPLFRLPQYIVFLAALLAKLEEGSDAKQQVLNAIRAIHQVADHVTNNLRDDAQRRQVVKFQEKLFKGSVDLVTPSRLVLKFGELDKLFQKRSRLHKSKRYLFILFNDMLLYASMRTAVQSAKVKHVLQLSDMAVANIPERDNHPVHNAFFIVSRTKPLTLMARSPDEKTEWMEALTHAIDSCKSLRAEFIGQPVPADGLEFEKMIFKKKFRTTIHRDKSSRDRRIQSMIEPELSVSVSVRPMPNIMSSRQVTPPPSSPLQVVADSSSEDYEEEDEEVHAAVVLNELEEAAPATLTEQQPLPPPPPPIATHPPPPSLSSETISHHLRWNSAPDMLRGSSPPPPPPPLPREQAAARTVTVAPDFLDEIKAGKELRKVEPAPTTRQARGGTSDFERDLHVQLRSSLDRYRKFVQHDEDDLSDSNSWD